MMFLLRTAFWLTIVLVLLPSGRSDPAGSPQVASGDAVSAASATVSDLGQFCTRQPDACTIGSRAMAVLAHRAQAGAKMVYEFATARMGRGDSESVPGRAISAVAHSVVVMNTQDTLSPADVALPWRNPAARPK